MYPTGSCGFGSEVTQITTALLETSARSQPNGFNQIEYLNHTASTLLRTEAARLSNSLHHLLRCRHRTAHSARKTQTCEVVTRVVAECMDDLMYAGPLAFNK